MSETVKVILICAIAAAVTLGVHAVYSWVVTVNRSLPGKQMHEITYQGELG